jgi:hypothetical protein
MTGLSEVALSGTFMAISGLSLIILSIVLGWWLRGKQPPQVVFASSSTERVGDQVGELSHLTNQVLVNQRNMATQLGDLVTLVQLLSHRVEGGSKPVEAGAGVLRSDRSTALPQSSARVVDDFADFFTDRMTPPAHSVAVAIDMHRQAESSATLEAAIGEFLRSADSREFDNAAVTRFFAERDAVASFLLELDNRWALVAVHSRGTDSRAFAIPAIRVGMRQVDLQPYFDLINYNGFDPIRGTQVLKAALLARTPSGWATAEKGIIDGSR